MVQIDLYTSMPLRLVCICYVHTSNLIHEMYRHHRKKQTLTDCMCVHVVMIMVGCEQVMYMWGRSVVSKLMTVMEDVLSAMWPVRYFYYCMVGLEWLASSM